MAIIDLAAKPCGSRHQRESVMLSRRLFLARRGGDRPQSILTKQAGVNAEAPAKPQELARPVKAAKCPK